MSQVDPVVTDYTPAQIAGAFVAAYRQMTGQNPPSNSVWLFPTAQAVKGEGWQAEYAFNNNVGNVTTYGYDEDWYLNPHVTRPLKFESFRTLTDGAIGMLKMLRSHRALEAAEAGDIEAYCAALAPWYFGPEGDYEVYCNNIRAGVHQYAGLLPDVPFMMTTGKAIAIAVGILGVAGAAAYLLTKEPEPKSRKERGLLPGFAFENPVKPPMHVQSLLFPVEDFTPAEAKAWAKSHGFRSGKVDVTEQYVRLRQEDPEGMTIMRTIPFGKSGIKAVVGRAGRSAAA